MKISELIKQYQSLVDKSPSPQKKKHIAISQPLSDGLSKIIKMNLTAQQPSYPSIFKPSEKTAEPEEIISEEERENLIKVLKEIDQETAEPEEIISEEERENLIKVLKEIDQETAEPEEITSEEERENLIKVLKEIDQEAAEPEEITSEEERENLINIERPYDALKILIKMYKFEQDVEKKEEIKQNFNSLAKPDISKELMEINKLFNDLDIGAFCNKGSIDLTLVANGMRSNDSKLLPIIQAITACPKAAAHFYEQHEQQNNSPKAFMIMKMMDILKEQGGEIGKDTYGEYIREKSRIYLEQDLASIEIKELTSVLVENFKNGVYVTSETSKGSYLNLSKEDLLLGMGIETAVKLMDLMEGVDNALKAPKSYASIILDYVAECFSYFQMNKIELSQEQPREAQFKASGIERKMTNLVGVAKDSTGSRHR